MKKITKEDRVYYKIDLGDKKLWSELIYSVWFEIKQNDWFVVGFNIANQLRERKLEVITQRQIDVLGKMFTYFDCDLSEKMKVIPIED